MPNGQTQHGADGYEAGRGKPQVKTESWSRTTRLREPWFVLPKTYIHFLRSVCKEIRRLVCLREAGP